ncbi:MAG TPA: TIGR00730 family Rossman fold protein, partial [Candidatus Methylomirabilis sp.]|nr:TIGR00730 family Rossman fold protein [Candidatus Methylomirabilis sp.]
MAKNTGSRQPFLSLLTELTQAEQKFLVGKRDRGADLESTVRIFLEFLQGFEFFGGIDRPCVTVFGSARFKPGHRYYKMARQLGSELAKAGYAVMTGGGP